LNDLFKLYDSDSITGEQFSIELDTQQQNITDLINELDLVPPKKYEEFNDYYFTSLFDQQNSIYYYRRYAENSSERDLYLARVSIENYIKNTQRAKETI